MEFRILLDAYVKKVITKGLNGSKVTDFLQF